VQGPARSLRSADSKLTPVERANGAHCLGLISARLVARWKEVEVLQGFRPLGSPPLDGRMLDDGIPEELLRERYSNDEGTVKSYCFPCEELLDKGCRSAAALTNCRRANC